MNSRDLAQTDGRVLVVPLILHDDKLDLVARLQLDTIVHLGHVEEQLLAFQCLVVQESKLQTTLSHFKACTALFSGH